MQFRYTVYALVAMIVPRHRKKITSTRVVLLAEYEQFLAGKVQRTRKASLRGVRHLMGWVAQIPGSAGQFQQSQLTPSVIEQYLRHLEQEGFSPRHCARVKSIIRHFVRFSLPAPTKV